MAYMSQGRRWDVLEAARLALEVAPHLEPTDSLWEVRCKVRLILPSYMNVI